MKTLSISNRFFQVVSNPPKDLSRYFYGSLFLVVAVLTLIPIINIANIVLTSGENNISNDVAMWADFMDKLLNGQASIAEFFDRSFFAQHFIPLHIITEVLNARLFGWNVFVTLFLGLVINVIKLGILFDLFTFPYAKNPFRWLLLPVLSALVFSNMEVTTFTGQNTATLIGMSVFGAVMSIWAIVRFAPRIKGVWLSLLGGFISTWSFALGLPLWPVTFLGLLVLGYRNIKHYLIWFAGAAVLLFPYFYFMVLQPTAGSNPVPLTLESLFNPLFIINMLGRPLNSMWTFEMTRQYFVTGLIGVVLAAICLVIFLIQFKKKDYIPFVPPLLIIALSVAVIWLASIARPSLASWYITAAWPFWQGIVGFGFVLLMQPVALESSVSTIFGTFKKITAVSIFVIVAFLYARSNIGNEVYGFLLYSRAPASAACLRDFQHAPTYCESYLFQWPIQRPEFIFELGYPLWKNQLSANSQNQHWTLQGDFLFDKVEIQRFADTAPIGWYEGLDGDRASWLGEKRWKRLDLLLYSPNSVQWTVAFPEYMESAVLKSAVGIREDSKAETDGVTFVVTAQEDGGEQKELFRRLITEDKKGWTDFNIDLSEYRGKKVAIQFTSLPGENNAADWAMYRHPVIDVRVNKHDNKVQTVQYTPENTDTYADFQGPKEGDIVWNGADLDTWMMSGLDPVEGKPGYYIGGEDPLFQLKKPVDLCLADYSHFYIKYSLPSGTFRVAQIYYQLNDGAPFSEERSARFTVYADGKVHMYTYPIRLLDLDAGYNARITAVRFDPAVALDSANGPVQFVEFGLLRGPNKDSSVCR